MFSCHVSSAVGWMLLIQKSELHKEDISHSQLLDHIPSNVGATQRVTLKLVFFPWKDAGEKMYKHNLKVFITKNFNKGHTFKVVTEMPFSASQIMLVVSSDAVANRCVPSLNDNPFTCFPSNTTHNCMMIYNEQIHIHKLLLDSGSHLLNPSNQHLLRPGQ